MKLPGYQSSYTRSIAAEFGDWSPRWLWLAMPDDVASCIVLARLLHSHEQAAKTEASYLIHELCRTAWRKEVRRPTRRPKSLRPSKLSGITGYRTNSVLHSQARQKVEPNRRAEIARSGAIARNAK